MPHSLLSIERSEWHRPQCSTCDFHLLGPERPEIDLLPNQFLFGRRGDPGVDECHL